MRASFILLAVTCLCVMGLTAIVGLSVHSLEHFQKHFLLGVLTAMFTCFVHVVLFMYFVVQDKIIRQAILHDHLSAGFAVRVAALKSRALRWSMIGIGAMLLTVGLGAAIGVLVEPGLHLVAAFTAIGVNALAFLFQHDLVCRYAALFREAFGEDG